jgi:hypothetical protein
LRGDGQGNWQNRHHFPEPAGQIVAQSGDIDNRIKMLLDSLKIADAN